MGDAYRRHIYKGAYDKPSGLLKEIEYQGFAMTATGAVQTWNFYSEATVTGGTIVAQIELTYNTTTFDELLSGKRII